MSLSTSLKHQETAADVPDVPVASGTSCLHVRTTDCAPDAINAAADGDGWVERGVEGLRARAQGHLQAASPSVKLEIKTEEHRKDGNRAQNKKHREKEEN